MSAENKPVENKYNLPGIPEELALLFSKAEEELHPKMKSFSEGFRKVSSLNDMNILERSMASIAIQHGFVNSVYAEKRKLEKMEKSLEALKENILLDLNSKAGAVPYKNQIVVDQHERVKLIQDAIHVQREVIRYLEDCAKILSGFNYAIKNSVESLKLGT
jgi:hypothetical protein